MRVDANVSVQRVGVSELGPRTEIKNISSIRGVANAITWEIKRQIAANQRNEKIVVETRSYDGNTKTTVSMRDKEEKQVEFLLEIILFRAVIKLSCLHKISVKRLYK